MINLVQNYKATLTDQKEIEKCVNFKAEKNWWKGFKKRHKVVRRKVTAKN